MSEPVPRVHGVMVVRNAVDVVRLCLLHHLAQRFEHIHVVDNGSTDGTATVLDRLSRRVAISWTTDAGPFHQAEITTALARTAHDAGAEWVVPIDADEFWTAPVHVAAMLARYPDAAALRCQIANFVQRRDRRRASPRGLMSMTMYAPPVGSAADIPDLVTSGRLGFVEARYPPKLIMRSTSDLAFATGSHQATGFDGPVVDTTDIVCLHAPLRSRDGLLSRAVIAQRLADADRSRGDGWHIHRWGHMGLTDRTTLDREWAANSYADDALDVYGARHPVIPDGRLRNHVAPWVRPAWKQALARVARRSY